MNIPNLKDFDLNVFFDLTPDLLCIAGYDGYFRKINAAVSKTLGYTNEELMSRKISSFVHPEDRDITAKTRSDIIVRDNKPLLNFENRYIAKSGKIVWLTWTSMPIESEQLVFAIAKNITYRKNLEEQQRIASILSHTALQKKTSIQETESEYAEVDQVWLAEFEALVRKYTVGFGLNLNMLSNELAISERQLFRRIKTIMGVTPNQYIRVIRLQQAMEAIESGKFRTVAEISYAAGFETPGYFSKLFKEIYNVNVKELLQG
jgi:PAS domain S-box-containing protein